MLQDKEINQRNIGGLGRGKPRLKIETMEKELQETPHKERNELDGCSVRKPKEEMIISSEKYVGRRIEDKRKSELKLEEKRQREVLEERMNIFFGTISKKENTTDGMYGKNPWTCVGKCVIRKEMQRQ